MRNAYAKPLMLSGGKTVGLIPAIIGLGMAAGSALGLAASSSAAIGGLMAGAAAGAAAGGVAAALAKKSGGRFFNDDHLPMLDEVVYS